MSTLQIPAGLTLIPRQTGLFSDFRRDLLASIPDHPSLQAWAARQPQDFGRMLLEMWAYCCDVLSFYDEAIAHETYVRTARQRADVRKLTGLLGYHPKPGLAATVMLAILAEGKQPMTLPAGTAFRSGAFPGHAPQIFEQDVASLVAPQDNQWHLQRVRPAIFVCTDNSVLLNPKSANVAQGEYLMFRVGAAFLHVTRAASVATVKGQDQEAYVQVVLDEAPPAVSQPLNQMLLFKTLRRANLWPWPNVSPDPAAVSGTVLILNGVVPDLQANTSVILECQGEKRWNVIAKVEVVMMQPVAVSNSSIVLNASTTYTVTPPAIKVPATKLTFEIDVNDIMVRKTATLWTNDFAGQITLHYHFKPAGELTLEYELDLELGDSLTTQESVAAEPTPPGSFQLEDANKNGLALTGLLDPVSRQLTPDQNTQWPKPLTWPVTIFGNLVSASRGETVANEVLGSGDASMPGQSFKLKKKPLTYLPDNSGGSDTGASTTLKVYVNQELWQEVPSFFGAGPHDKVYTVRQNDDQDSFVIGGDGERGSRFPTGAGNIVAFYRFGSGAATPPAGSITQLAKPIKGITSIRNSVAASPGSDAEPAKSIRKFAPRSALLLGRAISIPDFEAAAAGVPGVRNVAAEWTWSQSRQQSVVQIWYIGPAGVQPKILQRLHSLSDPSVPIEATQAQGLARQLSLDIACDPNVAEQVVAQVRLALSDPEMGILAPENIGIGKPLFRSRIFDAVLSVPQALEVTAILWEDNPWTQFYPEAPQAGTYYDFETGALILNGKA